VVSGLASSFKGMGRLVRRSGAGVLLMVPAMGAGTCFVYLCYPYTIWNKATTIHPYFDLKGMSMQFK
jgi:hypothetical protein